MHGVSHYTRACKTQLGGSAGPQRSHPTKPHAMEYATAACAIALVMLLIWALKAAFIP
jgi:hypothetical protein